ncbi:acetyltransferase [Solitalea longa]|uniref:Acetyltransferase n=1 Tax=Solitalea longa TaxID=2079460 RepID=A0A2S4ZYE1_9SPHI|nr:DapH/DapD/GlmU-related protein [Solitalea longa]POY34903.1 acetyltransferase [Solitalea longa]
MDFSLFLKKARIRIIKKLLYPLLRWIIIKKYRLLSTCINFKGKPVLNQALLAQGLGEIEISGTVTIGVTSSPSLFSTYAYFEVRKKQSKIKIEDGVFLNNNSCLISEGEGISIGKNTLIGLNFCAYDSDFHDLAPDKRMGGLPKTAAVVIGYNVFIGSNVTVLKGVTIGDNTVIANGSLVVKSIPANVIAGGNPCKVIKEL